MPLTPEQEQVEHELRVEKMRSDIDKTAFDIRMEDRKLRRQTYGIMAQVVGLVGAGIGAGIALATFFGPVARH